MAIKHEQIDCHDPVEHIRLKSILRVLESIECQHQSDVINDCAQIVKILGSFTTPSNPQEYKAFCEQIKDIQQALPKWCRSQVAQIMLWAFYQVIADEDKCPAPVLSIVLQLFNVDSIPEAVELIHKWKQGVMGWERALMTLCGWLSIWTMTPNLGPLVEALFDGLKKEPEHIKTLSRVTEAYLEPLFKLVILLDHRHSVWPVVLQMLSIQHHRFPVLDKVMPRAADVLGRLCAENSPGTRMFMQNFVKLACMQIKANPACVTDMAQARQILGPYEHLLNSDGSGEPASTMALVGVVVPMPSGSASGSGGSTGGTIATYSNAGAGRVGLHNLGNTCYMNSILQALFMTTRFRNDILLLAPSRISPLLGNLQHLFALLQCSGRSALEPRGVLATARPPTFLPGYQHDSSEFLGHLLDALHEQEQQVVGGGGAGDSTAVQRNFSGRTVTVSTCADCGSQSEHADYFRDLQLAFPTVHGGDCTTVQALLDYYLQPEHLTGDNQYQCDQCCRLTDGKRSTRVEEAPARLLLTLKHFRYDPATQLRTKLLQRCHLDECVQLKGAVYELYAAVVHCGHSLDAGHYYTYAQCGETRVWYKFNDAYVTAAAPGDLHAIPSPSAAYVLFYRNTDKPDPLHLDPNELPERLRDLLRRDSSITEGGAPTVGGSGGNNSNMRPPPGAGGGGACGGGGGLGGFSRYVC